MKKLILTIASMMLSLGAMSQQVSFLVGTYTQKDSKGVYKVTLEQETGHLFVDGVIIKAQNPSYVAYSKNRKYLGVLNESEEGTVSLYKINDGQFHLVNRQHTKGSYPCHISFDGNNNVYVANYGSGNVSVFKIEDKKLSEIKQTIKYDKTGPNTGRQEASHAHFSNFVKHSKTLYTVDLGGDEVHAYHMAKDGLQEKFSFQITPGGGPRHLVDNGGHIYVLEELTSKVAVYKKEGNNPQLVQEISMLPEGFTDANTGAAIKMSKDKKFLYATNRGDNSIVIFKVLQDGQLEVIGHESVRGDSPRDFSFSPKQNYIIVANQESDNITLFKRNKETGLLEFVGEAEISMPVNIVF
ncbi:lactonase family protein [Flammeovirga sp. MY04]|uniref:lactonase family protein n=1 Tax=Flammeovirga sp. MY04 TaxID=1191459 RepID=UPI000806393A|nr:lactonase family protein [Flammeovirga sp. MY04]ANQ49354.1 lactonase family protein [Flammeovirga sp. MY04]